MHHLSITLLRRFIPSFIALLVRLLGWSWRLKVTDRSGGLSEPAAGGPAVVWVFWHNRLLVISFFYTRRMRHRPAGVLISRSKDGELLSGVVKKLGAEPVRGSSSKGGATALSELSRRMAKRCDAWITPDGPRGPRYAVHPGAVWLAQSTGASIIPVSVEASSYWRLKSWDGFIIPKPFARVELTLQAPHHVPEGLDDEGMKRECARLREVMMHGTVLE